MPKADTQFGGPRALSPSEAGKRGAAATAEVKRAAKSVLELAKDILAKDPARAERLADKWIRQMEENPKAQEMSLLFDRQDGKVKQEVSMEVGPQQTLRDRTKVDAVLPAEVKQIEAKDAPA